MSRGMRRSGPILALALVACGTSNATNRPVEEVAAAVVTASAPEPDTSPCAQYVYDLFIGAYAIVEIAPTNGTTEPTSSGAFESTPFLVESILWADAAIPRPIERGEQRFATLIGLEPSQIGEMMAAKVDGSLTAVLVPTDVAALVPWRIAAVITPKGVNSGDVCSATYTGKIDALAAALGADRTKALQELALYLRNPDDPNYKPVGDFLAGGVSSTLPFQTPEEAWLALPVDSRDLRYGVVPKSFESRIDVFAVSIVVAGDLGVGDLSFRCDLGVGYAAVTNFQNIVRPLTTCTDAPTEVSFNGKVIATIDPGQMSKELGFEVSIRGPESLPSLSVRTLDKGELETLSGMTRQQLKEMEATIKTGGAPPTT